MTTATSQFEVIRADRGIVKAWVRGVPVEDAAHQQLVNIANMPFIYKWVAAMPDVHLGKGATIGSVIPTDKAIIPAAVGVDIGCGMAAHRTSLTASDLPDSLSAMRSLIEDCVPHGRTDNGGPNDCGAWGELPGPHTDAWLGLVGGYDAIIKKHPGIVRRGATETHLGTLGTGNHFIEVCLDQDDRVWVMLHSGSRGVGNRIGSYFITKAKELMEMFLTELPDKDLAFIPVEHPLFADYVEAVGWAQDFARINRELMMGATLQAIQHALGRPFVTDEEAVECHHNYIARENHYGKNVWVTRKGAVRARKGDLGIIPGSMGARSYIVEGLGNPESFHSCSHGAGRAMSRTEARRRFTLEDHAKATEGVECRKDSAVIDETPMAYKSIDAVMEAQKDLVRIKSTLRQVLCVKG